MFFICCCCWFQDFVHLPHYPVMIISYEMFMRTIELIRRVQFDLVVCDEGHRLKNTNIKTTSVCFLFSDLKMCLLYMCVVIC